MANTANFSVFYKARVIKAIVGSTRKLHAFGVKSKGQSPAAPTSATCNVTPAASTLGSIIKGNIPFARPEKYSTTGAQISNSAGSDQLTIPAGIIVHYVGLATADDVLLTYVKLTTPDDQYYYEEQGTLTIPTGGYTVRHP